MRILKSQQDFDVTGGSTGARETRARQGKEQGQGSNREKPELARILRISMGKMNRERNRKKKEKAE